MRHIARWRWALPFAQLCLILILVQWVAVQRATRPYHVTTPEALRGDASSGEAGPVGWDPRTCWDCDSVAPLPKLIFLGFLGVFYWVGGQLDRRMAYERKGRTPALPIAVAGCAYLGAVSYAFVSAAGTLVIVAIAAGLFMAVVQVGRLMVRRSRVPTRLPVILFTITAIASASLVVVSVMAPYCGGPCLIVGSCLVVFGMFSASNALAGQGGEGAHVRRPWPLAFLLATVAASLSADIAVALLIRAVR